MLSLHFIGGETETPQKSGDLYLAQARGWQVRIESPSPFFSSVKSPDTYSPRPQHKSPLFLKLGLISPRPDEEHTYFLAGPGLARSPTGRRVWTGGLCVCGVSLEPSPVGTFRLRGHVLDAGVVGGVLTLLARHAWLPRALWHLPAQGPSPSTWP